MSRLCEYLGYQKVGVRDLIAGSMIIILFAVVAMLLRAQPETGPMVISNFGPKQIPAESMTDQKTFPMWFVVDHVSASSRVVVDGRPVPSVVDLSAHAVTAMIPPTAFVDDGSFSISVTDRPTARTSNEVVIAK